MTVQLPPAAVVASSVRDIHPADAFGPAARGKRPVAGQQLGVGLLLRGYDQSTGITYELAVPPEVTSALIWDACCADSAEHGCISMSDESGEHRSKASTLDTETICCAPSLLVRTEEQMLAC